MAHIEATEFSTDTLWTEGRNFELRLTRVDATTLKLDWTIPQDIKVTTGTLVVISTDKLNPSNYPTDGVKYTATTDLSAPADTIGSNSEAIVVAANYDDLTVTSATITGAVPDQLYYAALHASSNIRQYYQFGILSYPLDSSRIETSSDAFTGDIPHSDIIPQNPVLGQVYFNPSTNAVYMWTGTAWITTAEKTIKTGTSFPSISTVVQGEFFYNENDKKLYIFNGTTWTHANTENVGTPMYNKTGIGTDGTYDERLRLINVLKLQFGWPTICVELNEAHYNMAIDNALDEFRRRADNAYRLNYYLLRLNNKQQHYYLNDPRNDTDKIVDVIKINRLQTLGAYTTNDSGAYAQTILNQVMSPAPVDMLSIHLLANLGEDLERLFAGNLTYQWNEASRELHINRNIYRDEWVIVETSTERTEQELLVDRWAKQWLQGWAHSECLETLGYIRSKFGSLPGANGGLSLNGDTLLARADAEQTDLLRQISDMEVGNGSSFYPPFLIG